MQSEGWPVPHQDVTSIEVPFNPASALFSSEKWKVFGTIAISFVCDKYYLIMD